MMKSNYNCLLIDLDGTLLDFSAAEKVAIAQTMQKFNLPCTEQVQKQYASINAQLWAKLEKGEIKKEKLVLQRFQKLLEAMGEKGDAVKLNNEFLKCLSLQAQPFPGAVELLAELAEFATLAAVSNGYSRVQHSRLEKSGLLPYFDELFFSEKLGVTKPSPKFFSQVIRKLGIQNKQKVLVVGDSLQADIQGGIGAKLDTCWCNFQGEAVPEKPKPTYVVQNYVELKRVAIGEEALNIAANREKRHTV